MAAGLDASEVYGVNKGLSGVGLSRGEFETWQESLATGRPLPRVASSRPST